MLQGGQKLLYAEIVELRGLCSDQHALYKCACMLCSNLQMNRWTVA